MADGFQTLRQFLERGELVAFVGAGLSKPGGLPLWSEFVQALRAESVRLGIPPVELSDIDHAIASNASIDALTELERYLGPASFARLVAEQLDDRNGPRGQPRPVPDVVRALADLASGLRAVITTNLDAFIPRGFPREWQSFERLTGDLASRRQYIFRLHGAIHDRETWVLTRSEYDRVMDRDPLYHTYFSAVFISQPMLFVGFGLADPHFDRIAQKIRALSRGQPPHHFALIHENEITPGRRRKLGECGIELLSYASHDALPAVLRSLMGHRGSGPVGGGNGSGTGEGYVATPSPSMAPTLIRSQPAPPGTPTVPTAGPAYQGHQTWELPQEPQPIAGKRPISDKRTTPIAAWFL